MNTCSTIRILLRGAFLAACIPALSLPTLAAGTTAAKNAPPTQGLPAALRPVFYQALARDTGAAYRINRHGCATLQKQSLRGCFDMRGAHFSGTTPLSLHLVAWGRHKELTKVRSVRPAIEGNEASYRHGNLTEWWRVLPVGFEQGFTIARRPRGHGELTLALAATRHSRAGGHPVEKSIPANARDTNSHWIPASAGMTEKGDGNTLMWGKLRYGQLVVTDANGTVVPARLKSNGDRILIAVNDAHAAYPLTVDPLVWAEFKATAGDGAANDHFGYSVALNGNVALVGAPLADVYGNADQGAVYVFGASGGGWTETQKLITSDGMANDDFGNSVALAGTTALVGAPCSHPAAGACGPGAAYVFTNSGGMWAQAQKLTASDGAAGDNFGMSIALAGTTAIVGANSASVNGNENQGAAYTFGEYGGSWSETQKLTASDGTANDNFGISVALDGITAAVGADGAMVNANAIQGAAYVFSQSGGSWSETQKLTASDGTANDNFGSSVAVSGTTALVGADQYASDGPGAAYMFDGSGDSWSETQKLTASDGAAGDHFGISVALDGTTAIVGAEFADDANDNPDTGAAYVFSESGSTWTQTSSLVAIDGAANDHFGISVALDGTSALIGAPDATINGNVQQGAAYSYLQVDLTPSEQAPAYVDDLPYVAQASVFNSGDWTSPPIIMTLYIPAAVSFISAIPSQGGCQEIAGAPFVRCDLGSIASSAGVATVNVTLKPRDVGPIENTMSIINVRPPLTASALTIATLTGCPDGYTVYSGHLDAGEAFTSEPIEVTEAGQKYVDLMSPASFGFFAIVTTRYGTHTYVYPHAKHGHRWGAAGTYQVGVQAGATSGDYTLCVNLNPVQ